MKTPYLVQRCSVKTRKSSEIIGIDAFLAYDYMGAAEFEFGQLNINLKAILPTLARYSIFETDLKCQTQEGIFLVCTLEQREFAWAWVGQEAIKNNRLKEPTRLIENLSGASEKHFCNFDVWWVLQDGFSLPVDPTNVWFFCKGKETARLLLSALKKSKERLLGGR